MAFYIPIKHKINETPLIIYPCEGVENLFDRKNHSSVQEHASNVYYANKDILKLGQYDILIIWNNEGNIMTDWWIYDKIESLGSGPLVDAKIFKELKPETKSGITAGDGLILLGEEERYRRIFDSLESYIQADRNHPTEWLTGIALKQKFYIMDPKNPKKSDLEQDVTYFLCPDESCGLFNEKGTSITVPCYNNCPNQDKLIKIIKCSFCDGTIELPVNHFSWKRIEHKCLNDKQGVAFNFESGVYDLIYRKPTKD